MVSVISSFESSQNYLLEAKMLQMYVTEKSEQDLACLNSALHFLVVKVWLRSGSCTTISLILQPKAGEAGDNLGYLSPRGYA